MFILHIKKPRIGVHGSSRYHQNKYLITAITGFPEGFYNLSISSLGLSGDGRTDNALMRLYNYSSFRAKILNFGVVSSKTARAWS